MFHHLLDVYVRETVFFNSREVIAEAIIGLLLVFYDSKYCFSIGLFFTGSSFVHAAVWRKSGSEKSSRLTDFC